MLSKKSKKTTAQISVGNLEVVSEESFLHRLEGMASCEDCQLERTRTTMKTKRQNKNKKKNLKQNNKGRTNSPIVIKLSDSLKAFKNRRRGSRSFKLDDDQTEADNSGCEYGGQNEAGWDNERPHRKNRKNFRTMISVLEQAHKKSNHDVSPININQYFDQYQFLPQRWLNNTRSTNTQHPNFYVTCNPNVDLICNDLHGTNNKVSLVKTTGDSFDSVDSELSSTDSGTSTPRECDLLSQDEIGHLAEYTTGFALTRYDCAQYECPECQAACSTRTCKSSNTSCSKQKSSGSSKKNLDVAVETDSDDTDSSSQGDDTVDKDTAQSGLSVPEGTSITLSACQHHSTTTIHYDPCDLVGHVKTPNNNSQAGKKPSVNDCDHEPRKRNKKPPSSSCQGNQIFSITSKASSTSPYHSDSIYLDLSDTDVDLKIFYHRKPVDWCYSNHSNSSGYPTNGYWYYPAYSMYPYYSPTMVSVPPTICVPRSKDLLASAKTCMIPAYDIDTFAASQPGERPWVPIQNVDRARSCATFTVMCYNVLCDKYCTRQQYGYCPTWALAWEYRKKAIMEELRHYSADIISLQEVETDQFYNFFLPELKQDGYDGIFSPKSRARTMSENDRKHVDGCAIFFKTNKFTLLKEHLMEFNQLAMATAEGSHDMINRVTTKDNIGLAALLETKEGVFENGCPSDNLIRQPILVATAHVHWDPEFSDVKLIQTMMLMCEMKRIIEEHTTSLRPGGGPVDVNSCPLILCGDLNSLPESGVIEYLLNGKISSNHDDFKDLRYDDCLQKLNPLGNSGDSFGHDFRLDKAYDNEVMPYTNYTYDFKGIIDYIFFSRDFMHTLGVLGPIDTEWFKDTKVAGCPHPHIPSDHFSLMVQFEMPIPYPNQRGSNGSHNFHTVRR